MRFENFAAEEFKIMAFWVMTIRTMIVLIVSEIFVVSVVGEQDDHGIFL
jgi:hypothetical protein